MNLTEAKSFNKRYIKVKALQSLINKSEMSTKEKTRMVEIVKELIHLTIECCAEECCRKCSKKLMKAIYK